MHAVQSVQWLSVTPSSNQHVRNSASVVPRTNKAVCTHTKTSKQQEQIKLCAHRYAQKLDLAVLSEASQVGELRRLSATEQLLEATEHVNCVDGPFILEGCTKEWAARRWTLDHLVDRFARQKVCGSG